MKALMLATLLALVFTCSALACDKTAARDVQKGLRDLATWYENDGNITFKWGTVWDEATPDERFKLISAAADADACLTGRAREIKFYRSGTLVGIASPTTGIRLIK